MLTDNFANKNQDLICLTSEISLGYVQENLCRAKKTLKEDYYELKRILEVSEEEKANKIKEKMSENEFIIYSFHTSFFNLKPFITNKEELFNEQQFEIPNRLLMQNFAIEYSTKTILKFIEPSSFFVTNQSTLNLNKIKLKISFTDMILFTKCYEFHSKEKTSKQKEWRTSLSYEGRDSTNLVRETSSNFKPSLLFDEVVFTEEDKNDLKFAISQTISIPRRSDEESEQVVKEEVIDKQIGTFFIDCEGLQLVN